MRARWGPWWPGALMGGLLFSIFGVCEMMARVNLAVDGVVVSSILDCKEPNRCVRRYVLRSSETGREFKYAAAGVDHALSRSIPNGARVVKKKGELKYTVDGRVIDDFPTNVYLVMLAITVTVVVAGSVAGIRWFRAYYRSL